MSQDKKILLAETNSAQMSTINLDSGPNNSDSPEMDQPKLVTVNKPKPAGNRDTQNMNMFLNPILQDLEKVMNENMKKLEKLEEDLLGDDNKKKEELRNQNSHIPIAIRGCKSIDTIIKSLEEIILNTEETNSLELDQSQKDNREFLETKFNQNSEKIREKLEQISAKKQAVAESMKKRTEDTDDLKKESSENKETNGIEMLQENIKLEKVNNISCLANSMSAYLVTANSRRNSTKLKNLTVKIYDAVNLWLSRLFRFNDSSVLFHEQEPEGFIRMCNIVLNYKFKDLREKGYQSFNRQPTIYISAASKYALPEYQEIIAIQLNLPLSSVKIATVFKENNTDLDKIDLPLLTQQIREDYDKGCLPLAIIANAGSYNIGQCDDLQRLNVISTTYRMWVHLEGVYLPTLTLYSVPTAIVPVMSGDSITIDFGNLIGVPSLSLVTIYKNRTNSNMYLQPYNNINTTLYKCLPYWCVLQSIGHDGVMARVKNVTDMTYYIIDILKKHKPYIQILSFKLPQKTTIKNYTLSELFVTALNFITFVDLNNPIAVFKCNRKYIRDRIIFFAEGKVDEVPEKKKFLSLKEKLWEEAMTGPNPRDEFLKSVTAPEPLIELGNKPKALEKVKSIEEIEFEQEMDEYADTLTTWLCDLLNSMHRNIELEVFEIKNEGVCIRYSPMEHANVYDTKEYDLHMFDKSLGDIITILDTSIRSRSTFFKDVNKFSNLMPVNIPKWAGIGAIRYIPDYLVDKLDEIVKYTDYLKSQETIVEEEKNINTNDNSEKSSLNGVTTEKPANDILEEKSDGKTSRTQTGAPKDLYDTGTKWQLDKYIKEINDINIELVKKLQAQDGAFSIGIAPDNMQTVKLGMVNDLEAVEKLASQIQEVGKSIEESSKYIEKMTDIVRSSIEQAKKDLKKETEDKLVQKGVMRQIPFVSELVNWISPLDDQKSVGRSLNLQSGKIETTEGIHKSRMQVNEDLINLEIERSTEEEEKKSINKDDKDVPTQ